jgi:flagellar biosynthesis protein FlhB
MSGGGEDDDTEKEHAPSQKRLDDARNRGEFARSADLVSAVALAGFVIAVLMTGATAMMRLGAGATTLLDQPDRLAGLMTHSARPVLAQAMQAMITPFAPLFLLPMGAVIAFLFAARGLVFTGEKLAPKLSRLSPIATAKQKFGPDGLFEFGKSTVKLCIISVLLFYLLSLRAPAVLGSFALAPAPATVLLGRLLVEFLLCALLISAVIGGLDYGWQVHRHIIRNRMSRKEMLDEMKDSDGDPHIKGQRRQRAVEIASNQMLADVATADVVIVNPTHYAVALRWKRGGRSAPVCVAKGVDEIAAQIRNAAIAAQVPIHSDPPTARALHATVEIGAAIPPAQFRAVAAAIRFAEAMRAKARKSWVVT